RKQESARLPEKLTFLGLADFAYKLDKRMIEKRFNLGLEICHIDGIHLCRELQFDACSLSNFDRAIRTLFRRDSSKESQIGAALGAERADVRTKTMRNRSKPIDIRRHWPSLCIRNRNERHFRIGFVERQDVREIEPPVQRHQAFGRNMMDQSLRQQLDMKMEGVER